MTCDCQGWMHTQFESGVDRDIIIMNYLLFLFNIFV